MSSLSEPSPPEKSLLIYCMSQKGVKTKAVAVPRPRPNKTFSFCSNLPNFARYSYVNKGTDLYSNYDNSICNARILIIRLPPVTRKCLARGRH